MLSFPGRAERAALQARSLLDGAVIATSLLYTSWALVLGHVQVGTSVGVTVSDASEVDAVLHEADVAMYTEKARGKGRFELASTSA
jgi:predicted signal transduction protein with EAL and GGDEF domain